MSPEVQRGGFHISNKGTPQNLLNKPFEQKGLTLVRGSAISNPFSALQYHNSTLILLEATFIKH